MIEFMATIGVALGSVIVTVVLATVFGAIEEVAERIRYGRHID